MKPAGWFALTITAATLAACGGTGSAIPGTVAFRDTTTLRAVPIGPTPTPTPTSGGLLGGLVGGLLGDVLGIVGGLTCGLTGLTCHVIQGTGPQGQPAGTPAGEIAGYKPADLQSAYALPSSTAGAGETIGIAVAFDNPNLEKDLGVYRQTFGLPACTTANGCFKKIMSGIVKADQGWGQESSIDVQIASAVCPKCNILVVEAPAATDTALLAAAKTAVANGATVLSDSYSVAESATEDDAAYDIVFGAGDSGAGADWPASSTHVIAVGGTSLTPARNARGWSETVWSGSGGGCSKYIAKPAWQSDPGCAHRTSNDIAAYADPNPGVAVFDSYVSQKPGWRTYGGTSVSAPIVAGAIALAGNGKSVLLDASYIYAHASTLNPVTSGTNGSCGTYLCGATPGYNAPGGNGSLNGVGAL
jgi:subtilase family serine protease